jgi:hypothetical protein
MITLSDNQVRAIKKAIGCKMRRAPKFMEFRPGMSLNSYWDSGCRDYYYFVNLKTFGVKVVPQNGTPFDGLNLKTDVLPPDTVLVSTSMIRGRDVAIYIYS